MGNLKKNAPDMASIRGTDENHTGRVIFLSTIITACQKFSIGGK